MIALYINAIERIRINRARSALAALRNSNNLRDEAAAAVRHAENELQMHTAARLARETQLYEQTLEVPLTPQDLERVQSKIQREGAAIAEQEERCAKLRDAAKDAASAAEKARVRHAVLLRAEKKWEQVREYHFEATQAEEIQREEISFDDVSPLTKSASGTR